MIYRKVFLQNTGLINAKMLVFVCFVISNDDFIYTYDAVVFLLPGGAGKNEGAKPGIYSTLTPPLPESSCNRLPSQLGEGIKLPTLSTILLRSQQVIHNAVPRHTIRKIKFSPLCYRLLPILPCIRDHLNCRGMLKVIGRPVHFISPYSQQRHNNKCQ